MTIGVKQSNGSAITGFADAVKPDRSHRRLKTPRTRVAQFGDGYEQRKRLGINNIKEEYSVSFINRTETEIDDLDSFLTAQGGVDKFMYTINDTNSSPTELDLQVKCEEWTVSEPNEGVKSLIAIFKRVYEA